jgi:hypothetical protein
MDEQTPSTPSPYADPAAPVLAAHPSITDEDRADLWDIFHNSKDSSDLANKLQPMNVPDDLKHKLFVTKDATAPAAKPAPVDKVSAAIARVRDLDPKALELAETHPNVLKALTTAAMQEEKAAGEPAGASKAPKAPKGPSGEGKAPLVHPDLPPTPAGHALIRTSDGALHHLPAINIAKAKERDPQLTVLHVEP